MLAACFVPVRAPTRVLFHAHIYEQWSKPYNRVGGIVSFLSLLGTCSAFCSLGWVVMAAGRLAVALACPCQRSFL